MNRINDKELNQYMKRIKLLLPLYRKQEKQFLTDFRFCIYNFTETHPEHSFADITAHFGTPDEVVRDYLSSLDVDLLCRQISVRKWIKRLLICSAAVLCLAFCVFAAISSHGYLQAEDAIVTEEVTVIE